MDACWSFGEFTKWETLMAIISCNMDSRSFVMTVISFMTQAVVKLKDENTGR